MEKDGGTGGNGNKFAGTRWLIYGEEGVCILSDAVDLHLVSLGRRAAASETNCGYIFCNSASRTVLRQGVKALGEVRVSGEGGLNGDDNIAGNIGDLGDCNSTVSVFAFQFIFAAKEGYFGGVMTLVRTGLASSMKGRHSEIQIQIQDNTHNNSARVQTKDSK